MGHTLHERKISMLETEIKIFMNKRQDLLRVTGAAALLIATLDYSKLSKETCSAVEILSNSLNKVSEENLRYALNRIKPELILN
ncbi:MAG: hypothetical protein CMH70_02985 [Nitrosomonadaceae bacterium]|nr:hypothetical protein [Nitrosomonadaceae bacterium]|tara:strand:- start:253 stop:504 length:252 start_codon:yes stop_codon:yes gene_type:complete